MTLWQGLLAGLGSFGPRFRLFLVFFFNTFVFLSCCERAGVTRRCGDLFTRSPLSGTDFAVRLWLGIVLKNAARVLPD